MVTRVKFCAKCGRPTKNKSGLCEDCSSDAAAGIYNRCSFCGKSSLISPLAYNIKTKKVYCKDCLNVFINGLRNNNIPEDHIKKIVDKDFVPVK
ncbi:MAG: double zinc ribbon domain-containing protein [Candidatus Heimdallarchaeaceae archaeon]